MKKLNQRGFSAVEGLLIAIIVLLIVFIGYYVWHTRKSTDKTLNITSTSQNSPAKKTAGSGTTQQYFTIKEWGVRAPYSGSLTLEYTIGSNTVGSTSINQYAHFGSAQLAAADPECTVADGFGGAIVRQLPTDEWIYEGGDDSGQTVQQYIAANSNVTYSKVGGYYYVYTGPNGVCSSSQNAQDLMTQTQSAVKQLVSQLQTVPQ